jgi:hypothetical protein
MSNNIANNLATSCFLLHTYGAMEGVQRKECCIILTTLNPDTEIKPKTDSSRDLKPKLTSAKEKPTKNENFYQC